MRGRTAKKRDGGDFCFCQGKNEKLSDVGGGGSKCSGSSFFILFYFIFNFKVKKIGFAP